MRRLVIVVGLLGSLTANLTLAASTCVDTGDTYSDYDNQVAQRDIHNVPSAYYLLSYTWAPRYCARLDRSKTAPGSRDYLQCGSGRNFGYILHGLWPQGQLHSHNYPRACAGDQPKIDRQQLAKYLCMTPSVWLLQHEYEYHGTCLPGASSNPSAYFDHALKLHQQLQLPEQELAPGAASIQWLIAHNPHLQPGAVQYAQNSQEWQFCYDQQFASMTCPANAPTTVTTTNQCPVKGNISGSGKRYYFTANHANYAAVKISPERGERCFNNPAAAQAAGWSPAP